MTAYYLGIIGTWIISDGIYSWVLYAHRQTWAKDKQQTFWQDHWVRAVRIVLGVAILAIGAIG